LAARFTEGLQPPFGIYAAFQVWAQAVEKAGTFETQAVAAALRSHPFDTVLGRIGFDQKGDVAGHETFVWYVWNRASRPSEPRPAHPAEGRPRSESLASCLSSSLSSR
jgi:hypothetical protein